MGFLDKAKAAATELQQKADTAMANSGLMGSTPGGMSGGPADRLLRDLGVLTYLNAQGRPGAAEDYHRVMEQLQAFDRQGALQLTLSPAAPAGYGGPGAPPPPPGAAAAAHAAAQSTTAPPATAPGAATPPTPPAPPEAVDAPRPPAPAAAPPADNEDLGSRPAQPETSVEDIELGGGGGTAPPPPPPSWS